MDKFNTKVNEAAVKYLSLRGYDIIEETWKREGGMLPVDIVAQEDDSIVFVRTKGRKAGKDSSFDDDGLDRGKLESFSVNWFTEHADEFEDRFFRFDSISMLVIGDDANKALLRHHINALSASTLSEEQVTSDSSQTGARKTRRAS